MKQLILLLFILTISLSSFGQTKSKTVNKKENIDIETANSQISKTRSDRAKVYLQEGLAAADDHNWEKALVHFQRSVELDSLSARAWANHGTAFLNTGMPGKAIISYNRSKALDDKDSYIFCSLSSACNRLKKYDEAIHHAEKALEIDPLYAPAMANKAWSLKQLGLIEKSDSLFKKAFELKPELRKHFEKAEE